MRGGKSESQAETDGMTIWLPPRAQTLAILLHEIAHVIELRAGRSGDHSPEFINMVISLWVRYLGAEEWKLRDSAKCFGLEGEGCF